MALRTLSALAAKAGPRPPRRAATRTAAINVMYGA